MAELWILKAPVDAVKEYFSPSSPGVQLTEGAEKGIKEIVEDATGKDVEDLTEEEKADVLADQDTKKLTKEEKANKVADGLAALAEGIGGMDGGQCLEDLWDNLLELVKFLLQELVWLKAVLKAVMQMANGKDPKECLTNKQEVKERCYSQAQSLLSLIDASPLSAADKAVQKQLINLQIGQQTLPLSPQYIASDAPYKALYRPYFSEVTKAYNAANPGPFSAMAGSS